MGTTLLCSERHYNVVVRAFLRTLIVLIAVVGFAGIKLIENKNPNAAWLTDLGYALVALPSLLFVGWLVVRATRGLGDRAL